MSLKKKIVYTALVLIPILVWVLLFTSADIIKFGTREFFWYDLGQHSSITLTNSYIFLIFKIVIGVGITLFGLYTFFKKKEVKWYYFIISLLLLSFVNLIPYNISKDLTLFEFKAPWIYGTLGVIGCAALVVGLEYLTKYEKEFFQAIKKCGVSLTKGIKSLFHKSASSSPSKENSSSKSVSDSKTKKESDPQEETQE